MGTPRSDLISVKSTLLFDWKPVYSGNLPWVPSRTIYLTRHGSHAYGTNLPTSDLDLRGVMIAPREYYLGFLSTIEQVTQSEPDLTIFELRKFMKLAAECNPNVLEILYTDESDHLVVSPRGTTLLGSRELFLSQRAKHTFSGYATQQLKRINTHYRWIKTPPVAPPTRAEFNLPEHTLIPADQLAAASSTIHKRMDEWNWHELEELGPANRQSIKDEFYRRLLEITKWSWKDIEEKTWTAAATSLGFSTNFIELLDLERRYTSKLREWQQFQDWKKNRNPDRAKLEEQFGYDTKHAMHLVRLLRMCREILTEGKVIVRRPDAEDLLRIRAGAWNYYELVEWAAKQDVELTELSKVSKLPKKPDLLRIDSLCIDLAHMRDF